MKKIFGSRYLGFALTLLAPTCAVFAQTPKLAELESIRDARLAPIVIVGVIEKDERVGSLVSSKRNPSAKLQIRRAQVHVENILKGDIDQKSLSIYYLGFYGGYDGPRPLGFWRLPSRRILFIRRDGDILRIACDVVDCTMPVYSGAHSGYIADPRKPLNYALTDIQLTRGEGPIVEGRFTYQISTWMPSMQAGGYAIEKLEHLASTDGAPVKEEACKMLWIYTVDKADADLPEKAQNALQSARCECHLKSDGNIDCH